MIPLLILCRPIFSMCPILFLWVTLACPLNPLGSIAVTSGSECTLPDPSQYSPKPLLQVPPLFCLLSSCLYHSPVPPPPPLCHCYTSKHLHHMSFGKHMSLVTSINWHMLVTCCSTDTCPLIILHVLFLLFISATSHIFYCNCLPC